MGSGGKVISRINALSSFREDRYVSERDHRRYVIKVHRPERLDILNRKEHRLRTIWQLGHDVASL